MKRILLFMYLSLNALYVTAKVYDANKEIYQQQYWNYQHGMGDDGSILDLFKFEDDIKPDDTVIEFGCGGGFLLNNLRAKRKIGIEINPCAHVNLNKNKIEAHFDVTTVPDSIADVIITNHALEHVFNPYETLCELRKKLKVGGLLIIVVPSEQAFNEPFTQNYYYREDEPNHHVFTWTPLTLGNLVKYAGFSIVKAEAIQHCWVGNFYEESRRPGFSLEAFHARCREEAIRTHNYQVRVVAKK